MVYQTHQTAEQAFLTYEEWGDSWFLRRDDGILDGFQASIGFVFHIFIFQTAWLSFSPLTTSDFTRMWVRLEDIVPAEINVSV